MFKKYVETRIEIFDRIKAQKKTEKQEEISIRTAHGECKGMSHKTTPYELSKTMNPDHKEFIVARVNNELWDAQRPLEKDSLVEFLTFEHEEGRKVFWHSSAHILGEACESAFCSYLCLGPPTDSGFFYEMSMDRSVVPEDYKVLRKEMKKIVKDNQNFERLEMTKSELLEMFADNPLKVELIKDKVETKSTVYRCGPLIDFCLGPHIPSTGYVKAIDVLHNSSSFFLGDSSRPVLQRVYGVSFPSKEQLALHLTQLEEAKKNNHRKIGNDLSLFFFSQMSPGSCFFLPKGAHIYNALVSLMKEQYKKRNFKEVITPNVFTNELWKTSGHLDKYKEDMFCFKADNTDMALKPMNCPGHCLLFEHLSCSYRDLPLRIADFGVLHRNEVSGALTGLTRVRRFQQDDAHIFVSSDKVAGEIQMCLEFLEEIYDLLGFKYTVCLSTRPEKYIGEVEVWDKAEEQLKDALEKSRIEWSINEGDGAFYGPKIDISVSDALGRKHQCGTVQLDFQLPLRFDLKFANAEGTMERPVMIHRAILGSVERMTGILLEHYKGRLPPWLNPNQIAVIPITNKEAEYAEKVAKELFEMEVLLDTSECTLNKKILNAEKLRYSYILIVGAKEAEAQEVSIRNLKDQKTVTLSLSNAKEILVQAIKNRVAVPSDALNFLPQEKPSAMPVPLSQALICIEKIIKNLKSKILDTLNITAVRN
ncbi:threonyl-tRNA synthetase [Nematocida minor]|uniref:threonyl-tRNA synthetase n=1 Tax=Nematocida minor TaxID=1912983 RepID=UPI00221F834B|nr:threonyl-tRNA synthetase [Nematocida minor]KAI5192929.1 threonyl-tRNA synthetase [Nematocida minor]